MESYQSDFCRFRAMTQSPLHFVVNWPIFTIYSNHVPIVNSFWDVARHWSKIADLNLPHLYLSPPLGVTPFKFRWDFWQQKTEVPGLLYGVVCVILGRTPTWGRQTDTRWRQRQVGLPRQHSVARVKTAHSLSNAVRTKALKRQKL